MGLGFHFLKIGVEDATAFASRIVADDLAADQIGTSLEIHTTSIFGTHIVLDEAMVEISGVGTHRLPTHTAAKVPERGAFVHRKVATATRKGTNRGIATNCRVVIKLTDALGKPAICQWGRGGAVRVGVGELEHDSRIISGTLRQMTMLHIQDGSSLIYCRIVYIHHGISISIRPIMPDGNIFEFEGARFQSEQCSIITLARVLARVTST